MNTGKTIFLKSWNSCHSTNSANVLRVTKAITGSRIFRAWINFYA